MRTDLHIHTVASDGCWTPARLILELQAQAIGLFAVADHDSVASVPEAERLAREAGLAFLRGVEVSTCLEGYLFHVLAYGFDLDNPRLLALLQENQARQKEVSTDIIRDLLAAGYAIDLDEYAAYEYDRTRGGWKAFNFLIDQGLCTDLNDYFRNLIAHIPARLPSFPRPAEAIAVIQEAGGVPILAHPGISLDYVGLADETLRPFLGCGIAGLECYSSYHDEATMRFCLNWCNRHGLLVTGGSDCHGGFVEREVGVPAVDLADLQLGELAERVLQAETPPRRGL